jgi:hypothetical protein
MLAFILGCLLVAVGLAWLRQERFVPGTESRRVSASVLGLIPVAVGVAILLGA